MASRHYAFEGQCFVLAAGTVLSKGEALDGLASLGKGNELARELLASMPGEDSLLLMSGGSCVIRPDAEFTLEPVMNRRETLQTTIDLGLLTKGNLTLDTSAHYARPDIFQLHVNSQPQNDVTFF